MIALGILCEWPLPEIIDPVFAKTSQNARFLLSENERFGLVFMKTGSINSGTRFRTQIGQGGYPLNLFSLSERRKVVEDCSGRS
jgi:hypothetical protein